jgi:hypothetical protein
MKNLKRKPMRRLASKVGPQGEDGGNPSEKKRERLYRKQRRGISLLAASVTYHHLTNQPPKSSDLKQ